MTKKAKASFTIKEHDKEYHEGFLIRRIKTMAGIRFQVDFGKSKGRYERKSFHTLNQARGCAADRRLQLEQHGYKAKTLTNAQRMDAIAAFDRLEEYSVTLQAAAEFYAKHHQKVDQNNGVVHLIDKYLAEQAQRVEDGTMRPRTYEDMPKRLKPLKERLGHVAIDAISPADIRELIFAYNPRNASNYKRYMAMFFNWAIRQDLVVSNPVNKLEVIRLRDDVPEVYDPKDVQKIMNAATNEKKTGEHGKAMVPYFALAFFAGIRPEEIRRLNWKDIDLESGVITIRGDVSKTKRSRHIEMPANLRQWLAMCSKKNGLVFPYSESSVKRWRVEVYEAAGVKGIQDGARHSMATYYLADGHTIEQTTDILGHAQAVLFKHYKGLQIGKQKKAKAYFNIRPKPSVVIKFPVAKESVA